MNVSVFGGAQPVPGEPAYTEAQRLGKLLAEAGHCVLTGGYIGTMEAVSRGACEAGGHVVGVTCRQIEDWRKVKANPWVKEERRFDTLRERLHALVDGCDATIALPGGAGTLTEVALVWNELIVDALSPRPLILVGPGWQAVMTTFFENFAGYLQPHHQKLIQFAPSVDEVVAMLDLFFTTVIA